MPSTHASLHYHLIFSTKDRMQLITIELRPRLHAYLGGIVAGWFYAHLLGFGRASILQRALRQRRTEVERYRAMTLDQFISEEVDPILDKISREGLKSLTWNERRILARAQEKIAEKAQAH